MYETMRTSNRIEVLDGDITQPNFGLSTESLAAVMEASVVIHAASSINLAHPLTRIAKSVIYPSLELAKLVLNSTNLDRFVYISTAYSNAHLHQMHDLVDTEINEQLYPLKTGEAEEELEQISSTGTTQTFEAYPFPFAYSYAKHLTERLLSTRFDKGHQSQKLLIVRPSIIGPALAEPFPYYGTLGSVPGTAFMSGLVLTTSLNMTFASPFDDPDTQSNIDEVPVDIVVNRIVTHTAAGSTGCVHAVAGKEGRRTFKAAWDIAMKLRALPWTPGLTWKTIDWGCEEVHAVPRIFKVFGTSYLFDQSKTDALWEKGMTLEERLNFPLYLRSPRETEDLGERCTAVRDQITWLFGRKKIPLVFVGLFLRDVTPKAEPHIESEDELKPVEQLKAGDQLLRLEPWRQLKTLLMERFQHVLEYGIRWY